MLRPSLPASTSHLWSAPIPIHLLQPQQQRARPEYVPNRIDDPDYVRIFDTTLRDGEQSPGATLTSKVG